MKERNMKYFFVFAYDKYYPKGGWQDCIAFVDSLGKALIIVANSSCDCWHIVDSETLKIVEFGTRDPYKD